MKKTILILAAISAVSFSSCKKDRDCECVTSYSGSNISYTDKVTYVKVTKGQAKNNCISTKWDEKSGNSTVSVTKTCTLK